MITEHANARKAEYYDLSGTDMEPPLEIDSSSSDEQNYRKNHAHIEDYFNSIRDLKNESMLKEMEAERRMQEITENNSRMFTEELYNIHGEHEMQNMQQQQQEQVINDLLLQMQTPYGPIRSDTKPKPLFPQAPQDSIMQQHLRAVGMSQQPRKPNDASSSNNDPESTHELKGNVGRPRNHGVPTESRKDPFY